MTLSLEQHSKQFFQYGDKVVEYNLVKSKRRKTCEVIVDKNGIIFRAPFDKSLVEVEKILNDKIKWISQKQKKSKLKSHKFLYHYLMITQHYHIWEKIVI